MSDRGTEPVAVTAGVEPDGDVVESFGASENADAAQARIGAADRLLKEALTELAAATALLEPEIIEPPEKPPAPARWLPMPAHAVPIGAATPFRATGDCDEATWQRTLKGLGSPITGTTLAACRNACAGLRALALSQTVKESSGGTAENARATNNPLGLMQLDGSTLMRFSSWEGAYAEWFKRMTDPAYKAGVYGPVGLAMGRFIKIYVAGPNEGYANGESPDSVALYLTQTVQRINDYRKAPPQKPPDVPPPTPARDPIYGRVPRPSRIVDDIIPKPPGHGYSNYGPRADLIAVIIHNALGAVRWVGNHFRSSSGHGLDALTDWGVCSQVDGPELDGVIYKWNDPDGSRSPWASGGDRNIHGDGPALYALARRLGLNINQCTEAIETSRMRNYDPLSAKSIAAIAALTAYRMDVKAGPANGTSWETWPKNGYGVQAIGTHAELGKPECNAIDIITALIDIVGDTLEKYQRAAR